ncbi:Retrovirus-related Pol polyprotein from transposon RE1 [Sesamum angolense]|uniref:Retrovirus-related Pol polyprotein from transposon RE1 n=1 Tax=Sesamum angolense TaxID=2727404 RepID=A0AAE1VZA3_9LAMI|nr:Retrovirus-related Pol polyprotein from transposon RE1 [Sesamum angolense]
MKFMAALSTVQEPRTYTQAKEHSEWQQAMHQELTALEENKTWEVVDLPSDKRAIGCKWVYKVKLKPDGSVDRYKARLVAKGYNQIEGIDYVERFSPVAKAVTVRIFLALASGYSWAIHQASRQWNQEFTSQLLKYGFMQSQNDHCLFIQLELMMWFFSFYVDDVLITSSKESLISPVKDYLHKLFTIKDMGLQNTFLAWKLPVFLQVSVTQQKYIRDLVVDAGLEHAKSLLLLFLWVSNSHPVEALFWLILSLIAGLFDADWASCIDSRRSLTGLCVFLGRLSFWKTKKQPTVSRSSAEAEYRSLASTICELRWISYLLQDFQVHVQTPIPLFCDNQAVVHITANPIFHERTKHLEIDCHLVREKYKEGFVLPSHISGKQQLADIFTKCLPGPAFSTLLFKLGLVDFSPSPT